MKQFARLDTMFGVMTGAKPYQVGKGTPSQTKATVIEKPFTGYEKLDDSWLPYMRGRMIEKYVNKWKGCKEYIKYGEWLAEPRTESVFKGKKLLVRQTGDSLIATYDEGNVSNNTLHSIYLMESNRVASLYYLLGIINSKLLNWYYQIENYLEIGKPMAEVKGIYLKKLPIAIGTKEQIQYIEETVARLLNLCQSRYDKKYSFIHYIQKTYEPKKITEKMEDFELLSYKDFIDELKKQKVKLTELQKMELLEIFDDEKETVMNIDLKIKAIQKDLDFMIFDIYKIKEAVIHRIMD